MFRCLVLIDSSILKNDSARPYRMTRRIWDFRNRRRHEPQLDCLGRYNSMHLRVHERARLSKIVTVLDTESATRTMSSLILVSDAGKHARRWRVTPFSPDGSIVVSVERVLASSTDIHAWCDSCRNAGSPSIHCSLSNNAT
jgi:hypothetical protein